MAIANLANAGSHKKKFILENGVGQTLAELEELSLQIEAVKRTLVKMYFIGSLRVGTPRD